MDPKQKAQLGYYDKRADDFDRLYNRENPNHYYKVDQIGRLLFDCLPAKPDGYAILELGAGTGIHAERLLHEYGPRIRTFTVSDISSDMLEQARTRLDGRYPQVRFLVSPAEQIATAEKFDGIYVSGAMHHFAAPEKAIAGFKARLLPRGMLVICEPIVWNPVNLVRAALKRVEWGQFNVTRGNIRRCLEREGYEIEVDRVLHWKGGSSLSDTLWPYAKLEKITALDTMAIMFLMAASERDSTNEC
jgi:ubiquinone/menaquinone biosynthesis C-methylase UbiE